LKNGIVYYGMILVMKKSLVGSSLKAFSLVVAVFAVIAFVANFGGNFAKTANASTSTSTTQTINVTVNQVITLSLGTSTLTLPSLTPGAPVTATTSATVTTNASAGWQLDFSRNSATSTIASGTITFPDATPFNGSNATTTANLTNGGQVLAFRAYQTGTSAGIYNTATWGTNDTTNALWAGFPTSTITAVSTSSYIGSAQTIVYGVYANSPATQVATTYSGTITVTEIALP
jgi:hypothetical protein